MKKVIDSLLVRFNMSPHLKFGYLTALIILAMLALGAVKAASLVKGENSIVENAGAASLFDKMRDKQTVPDFVISKDDEMVIKNKISDIVGKVEINSDTAYFIFFDKLLLSYYLSYDGPNKENVLKSILAGMEYDAQTVEVLNFSEASTYYKQMLKSYKDKIAKRGNNNLNNPNSLDTIISDYLIFVNFVFAKPENLNITISGLEAYMEFVRKEPTPSMIENPHPDMCMLARIHPDMKRLPEELNCSF